MITRSKAIVAGLPPLFAGMAPAFGQKLDQPQVSGAPIAREPSPLADAAALSASARKAGRRADPKIRRRPAVHRSRRTISKLA